MILADKKGVVIQAEDEFFRDRKDEKIELHSHYGDLKIFSGSQCKELT